MDTSLSLLERLRGRPDEAAWRRFDDLYRPYLRRWLLRQPTLRDEAEDLVQDVMSVLVRELPHFERERTGSFRRWLLHITVNRVRAYYRSRRHRPLAPGADRWLAELQDPTSEMSRWWDQEHDQQVFDHLLALVRPDFTAPTWEAFQRFAMQGQPADKVAADLGTTRNAVILAKRRILRRLRQEAAGLLD